VRCVCSAWGCARSTFYAAPPGSEPGRRGPSPAVSDEELYALIADGLEGTITTTSPDLMWGADGTRVQTAEEGVCWIFSAVDHYSCEVVGSHVCKKGNRCAALQPTSQGLAKHFGGIEAEVGRGLSLRMDNGSQYVSEHFRNQVRFWGVEASYAFIEQPQTNGVAERVFRTLKEKIVYGRSRTAASTARWSSCAPPWRRSSASTTSSSYRRRTAS